jgi:hypothetical protein
VSVEAISWALNLAPVPADRGGPPSTACKFVLVGLANHAGPDGTGAFPSVATLVRYTGLSERTVRTCLDRLEAEGIIAPCAPAIVAARIKRADRRPQGWDLNLSLVRDDIDELGPGVPEHQPSARRALLTQRLRHVHEGQLDEVPPLHPAASPVDNSANGVQQLHPGAGTGCNQHANGVQAVQPRGAAAAPEPYVEPSIEPPAAPARAREAPLSDQAAGGGAPVGEFFADLADAWLVTAEQRARLAPAVKAALDIGWTPSSLAAFTGANIDGVRSPYAVLTSRLSPAELPRPIGHGPPRPPWCGQCDQATRMLGFDGDSPRPCPRCKPGTASGREPVMSRTGPGAAESV